MTTGNAVKHILLFSLSALIGNIFQQVYNLADSIIVGKIVGADALAAVGASGSITFFFFALCNGIGMGVKGIWLSTGLVWAISGITAWMRYYSRLHIKDAAGKSRLIDKITRFRHKKLLSH